MIIKIEIFLENHKSQNYSWHHSAFNLVSSENLSILEFLSFLSNSSGLTLISRTILVVVVASSLV